MTNWKPKDLNEELENCIGGTLNDAIICQDLGGGDIGPEYIDIDDIDTIVKRAIVDIVQSDYIEIRFKEEK